MDALWWRHAIARALHALFPTVKTRVDAPHGVNTPEEMDPC